MTVSNKEAKEFETLCKQLKKKTEIEEDNLKDQSNEYRGGKAYREMLKLFAKHKKDGNI